jgi:sulfoxide reductase heme-binding subunit YedZ
VTVDQHAWWLVSRSAGVAALLAMTLSTLIGLALANGLFGRRTRGAVIAVHEHLSAIALVGIGIHAVALLGDDYLHPAPGDLLVPGLIDYRPVAVATGIAGGYLAVLLTFSFYARRRFGAERWRKLHRFSAVAYVLSVVHTLAAGSDAGAGWLRVPLFAGVGIALALLSARLPGRRSGSRTSSRPRSSASARSPAR